VVWAGLWLAMACPTWPGAVYIEDSPAAQELADEAQTLAEQDRHGEAAQRLQQIIDEYPQKLMPTDDGAYRDASLWVRDRLASDAALLTAYRKRFSPVAERALAEALSIEAVGAGGLTDGPMEGFGAAKHSNVVTDSGLVADSGGVRGVWGRYALTPAGLDAALWLAGRSLESGDGLGAWALLAEAADHPDLAAQAARYHELRAWSAALAEDHVVVAQSLDVLAELVDTGESDRVQVLRETLAALSIPGRLTPGDAAATKPPPLTRPLWQVRVEERSPQGRLAVQRRNANGGAAATAELRPVASANLLLFNDSDRVFALDRTSGRLRWNYRHQPNAPASVGQGRRRLGRVILDRRRVLLRSDTVYAVVGFAVPWQARGRGQTVPPTQLVNLDAETGEPRWAITPGDLDPGLARTSFHGTPVAFDNQIIVMARRSQASGFQDSYLVSVGAATGKLRWRRHLSSTAGPNNRSALAAMSRMTLVGQRVYFCDNLGAAAAIDARTGAVHWVRVLAEAAPDDQSPPPQDVARPFSEEAAPMLCAAGLLLPLNLQDAHGLLLDPDTGRIKHRFEANEPIASATQLLPIEGDVLVVGSSLSRLDGATLKARWTFTPPPEGLATPLRVTLHRDTAVVCSGTRRIDRINLSDGKLLTRHELPWNGRVLVLGDAWVVSSGRRIGNYLDWSAAFAELRRRAQAQPDSPDPGLNMALLAVNANQVDAVSEGIDHALTALTIASEARDRDPSAWKATRARVFRELLSLAERHDVLAPAVIERVFDRLAVTTDTPEELVAYNFGRGAFLEAQGRLSEAADFYQAVLLDAQLANAPYVHHKTTRRSDLAARQHLRRLVKDHGRAFYERYDQLAQQELRTLMLDPTSSTSDLLALVGRYPLAKVSAEAVLVAAERQSQTSAHAGCPTQYRRAFQLATDDATRGRAAGALASYYQQHGRPDAARRWLELIARSHPNLQPLRSGQPLGVAVWLDELRGLEPMGPVPPHINTPFGQPIKLAGHMMPMVKPEDGAEHQRDSVLIRMSQNLQQLTLYGLPDAGPRWTVPLPDENLILVHLGQDNVLLWSVSTGRLHGLDAATGRAIWPAIQARTLLEDLGEGGLAQTRRDNAGQIIELFELDLGPNELRANRPRGGANPQPRVVAGRAVVCIVDHKGRTLGIDRYTGLVLWQSALAVDLVTHIKVMDDVIAVAGVAAPGTESEAGRVLLIDLATGEPRFPPSENREHAYRLDFTPSGDLLVLTRTQATLLDRLGGGIRWRTDLGQLTRSPTLIAADGVVFIHDNTGIVSLDLSTGQVLGESAHLPARGVNVALGGDGQLFSLTKQHSSTQHANLALAWRDAIAHEGNRLFNQCLGEQHVLILAHAETPPQRNNFMLYALERSTGRIVDEMRLQNITVNSGSAAMRIVNNALLLTGHGQITIVPGAPGNAPGNAPGSVPETSSEAPKVP